MINATRRTTHNRDMLTNPATMPERFNDAFLRNCAGLTSKEYAGACLNDAIYGTSLAEKFVTNGEGI